MTDNGDRDLESKVSLLLDWDLLIAATIAGALWLLGPAELPNKFTVSLYQLGTSLTAIVFSVFFAALAIIMSAGNDDFIQFLADDKEFERILFLFKFTLFLLFSALVVSGVLYGVTSWWLANNEYLQPVWLMCAFLFVVSWSLLATLTAAFGAIRHSQLHVKFTRTIKSMESDSNKEKH